MQFDEYQQRALTTLHRHPDRLMDTTISAMGISGEAGEVLEKWKKIVAYREGIITDEDRKELSKELGDVLWYIAVFADNLGLSLDAVAAQNLAKLASRKARDVIKGQGDNR
jgi:NTP pyrophosphatase (non-canonical NTP hydrolase)